MLAEFVLLCEPDAREQLLRLLAASSVHPVLVHVLSPDELEPDLRDVAQVVDAETGETLVVRDGEDAQQAYATALATWLAEIDTRCRTLGIRVLRVTAGSSITRVVEQSMRRASLVEDAAGGNQ